MLMEQLLFRTGQWKSLLHGIPTFWCQKSTVVNNSYLQRLYKDHFVIYDDGTAMVAVS